MQRTLAQRQTIVVVLALIASALVAAALAVAPQWALAAIVLLGFAVLCVARPGLAIPTLVVYTALLGLIRRFVSYELGEVLTLDPLIVVVPGCALILGAMAINRGALRDRTPLTNTVLVLLVLAVVGAFNPLQGSPVVGLTGLTFFGAPYLWFFVGRVMCSDTVLRRTYRWIAVTVVLSSFYGLAQSFGRFTAFDRVWSETTIFQLGGELRPFGWASSPGEYARLLTVAIVIIVFAVGAGRFRSVRWFVIIPLLVPLMLALMLASVRSAVVYLVLALGITVAARRGARMSTIAIAGMVGLAVLWFGISSLGSSRFASGDNASPLISHQVEGLSDPTDSTATARFDLLGKAVVDGIRNPIGSGTGITTRAAVRGGTEVRITESDLGDAAVSWGVPGMLAVGTFVVLAMLTLVRVTREGEGWLPSAALAIFTVATFRWVNGGLYAVAPLVLLGLGWADRRLTELRSSAPGGSPSVGADIDRSIA